MSAIFVSRKGHPQLWTKTTSIYKFHHFPFQERISSTKYILCTQKKTVKTSGKQSNILFLLRFSELRIFNVFPLDWFPANLDIYAYLDSVFSSTFSVNYYMLWVSIGISRDVTTELGQLQFYLCVSLRGIVVNLLAL